MKSLILLILVAGLSAASWAGPAADDPIGFHDVIEQQTHLAPEIISAATPYIDSDLTRPWVGAVAILTIAMVFGMPVVLVAAVLYASHRKRRLAREMAGEFLASGQPVPPEVWQGLAGDTSPRSHLRKGMVMLGAGIGVFLCFRLMGRVEAAYLGLIPLFIGIAQLLIWRLERNTDTPGE